MNPYENPYASPMTETAHMAATDARADFILKTYLHLAGAIAAFVGLEAILLNLPITESAVGLMVGSKFGWLIVLLAFIGVSTLASNWASSATDTTTQYLGLGLYVLAEAVIFAPLLFIIQRIDPAIIPAAAFTTLGLFGVLTAVVMITRSDFSYLRSILVFGGLAALGLIVVSILFQFALGPVFTYAMIALACCYILYDTSNVLHHYRIGQHVAASLALFASVALLFWYILRLFLMRRD